MSAAPGPGLDCCLVSIGSRGDVTPFIALGQALQRRGHRVRLVVLAPWRQLVRRSGLDCVPVPLGDEVLWPAHPLARRAMVAQPGLMWAGMTTQVHRSAATIVATLREAAGGADVLVSGLLTAGASAALAERQQMSSATLLLGPLLPSPDASRTVLGPPHVPGIVTLAASAALWRMTRTMGASTTRRMARELGPAPRRPGARGAATARTPDLTLMATSPAVSPPEPGWPQGLVQVGRLVPEPDGQALDPGLAQWLGEHPDAVLMDFGSVPAASAPRDTALLRAAARRVGRPAVLQTAALPPGELAPGVWNAPGADHHLLMPAVDLVVHHGGAGTSYAALAAGRPGVLVPHLGDQAYYARRVRELGVGDSPGPRWRVRPDSLARAMERVDDAAVRRRSARLADELRHEDGAATAAGLVEALGRG